MTVFEARLEFFDDLRAGSRPDCPVCDRDGHYDKRRISRYTANALKAVYKASGIKKHTHVPSFLTTQGFNYANVEFARLTLWGLVEGSMGDYRITQKGKEWIKGEITIPRCLVVYNDEVVEVLDREGEITFKDALNANFTLAGL